MTLQERIDQLILQHGTLRAAARVAQIDASYLSRLRYGEKENPTNDVLRRLGLRRVVSYELSAKAERSCHAAAKEPKP